MPSLAEKCLSFLKAAILLFYGRRKLSAIDVRGLISDATSRSDRLPALTALERSAIAQAQLAISTVANWVPWRADCLVQALAGQKWLSDLGIEASLQIGVPEQSPGRFQAHAWLEVRGHTVIGAGAHQVRAFLSPDQVARPLRGLNVEADDNEI